MASAKLKRMSKRRAKIALRHATVNLRDSLDDAVERGIIKRYRLQFGAGNDLVVVIGPVAPALAIQIGSAIETLRNYTATEIKSPS